MKPVPPESCFWSSSSSALFFLGPSGPKKKSNGSCPPSPPKLWYEGLRLPAFTMSVAVTETIAGSICSTMSAKDGSASAVPAAGLAAGAAAAGQAPARPSGPSRGG